MANPSVTLPQAGDEITATWGQSVAKAINGVQSGTANVTFTASPVSANTVVTFPVPFASAPVVVCNPMSQHYQVTPAQGVAVTATGFTAAGRYLPGTNASTTMTFNWVAVGPLP